MRRSADTENNCGFPTPEEPGEDSAGYRLVHRF